MASAVIGMITLSAAIFVALNVARGGVAYASDDWSTGHSSFRNCASTRTPSVAVVGSFTWTAICWWGVDVSVQGHAEDTYPDGDCALNRIRYKVFLNGVWSGWQVRNMATACGNGKKDTTTWWWSTHETAQVQAQACLRHGSDGSAFACSGWV